MLIRIAAFLVIFLLLGGVFYLLTRIRKFSFVKKLTEKYKWLNLAFALLPLAVIAVFCFIDMINTLVVVVHLIIFWGLSDLVFLIIKKAAHKSFRRYWQGLAAVAVTALYLGSGLFFNYHVFETDYSLTTGKDIGDGLRIVQISDSHIGNTFDGDGFAEHIQRIKKTKPDVVVITGDFVDDDTTKEDMIKSCAALGGIESRYGVYFVFGNHDKGYFGYRDFSETDLRNELEKNNVILLEDECVELGENFVLVGRQDRSAGIRKTVSELTESIDKDKYMIVLDHQPNDYDAEASAGADLVLSGHTHGGQMFPIGIIGVAFGFNDKNYGLEVRDGTAFIVNSGISCWAIQFKTATASEFAVIDVKQK